jgi:hypothetical protein
MTRPRVIAVALAALTVAAGVPGCGGSDEKTETTAKDNAPAQEGLEAAQQVTAADFPAVKGRSLQQMANLADPGAQAGLATSVLVPGENRLAFGMIDQNRSFVYGKSAVYIGRSGKGRAEGPFPAPADSLVVEPPFRSATVPGEDIAAIYAAQVRFKRPGRYEALMVTKSGGRLIGAPTVFKVSATSPVPAVGSPAPRTDTDTLASGGNIDAIDTRRPNDDMHGTNFKDVVGKKPVALLFATPALCQSRVCGPVVDIAAQLKRDYGDRVEFIHQEVYVDNDMSKGLRPPLKAFRLPTEPWLFAIDAQGRVAARLEGSFGINAFRSALDVALR